MMQVITNQLLTYLLDRLKVEWNGYHGLSHWIKVHDKGLWLAEHTPGADPVIAVLFGVLHDACREHDVKDPDHGSRASRLVDKLNGKYFDLSEEDARTLSYACLMHNQGMISFDPTVGVCWDADRLELIRTGTTIDIRYLSTEAAKRYVLEEL